MGAVCTFLQMLWTELVEMVKCMIVVAACLQSAVTHPAGHAHAVI